MFSCVNGLIILLSQERKACFRKIMKSFSHATDIKTTRWLMILVIFAPRTETKGWVNTSQWDKNVVKFGKWVRCFKSPHNAKVYGYTGWSKQRLVFNYEFKSSVPFSSSFMFSLRNKQHLNHSRNSKESLLPTVKIRCDFTDGSSLIFTKSAVFLLLSGITWTVH